MSDEPIKPSERAAKALFPYGRAHSQNCSQEEAAAIIARETGCDPHPDLCCCGKCAAEDAAVRDQAFVAEVMAGCDIQRGGTLYRQVPVILGPGKTQDQLDAEKYYDIVRRLADWYMRTVGKRALVQEDIDELQGVCRDAAALQAAVAVT